MLYQQYNTHGFFFFPTFLLHLSTDQSKHKDTYRQLSVDSHSYEDKIVLKLRNHNCNGKQVKKYKQMKQIRISLKV